MNEASREVRVRIRPEIGARMPAFVPRAVLAMVGVLLCLDRYPLGFWQVVGFMLAGFAAVVPGQLTAWGLIVLLGASQYTLEPSPGDWHFFLLLAGLHLIHVLAAQTVVLPWRGWIQLAVFGRPALRYVAIQAPVQLIAFVALRLLAPDDGERAEVTVPVVGIVGAAALVGLTLLLIVPLLRERARNS